MTVAACANFCEMVFLLMLVSSSRGSSSDVNVFKKCFYFLSKTVKPIDLQIGVDLWGIMSFQIC